LNISSPNYVATIFFNFVVLHRTPDHNDIEYFEMNICEPENVCTFIERNDIKKTVFTSPIASYGSAE